MSWKEENKRQGQLTFFDVLFSKNKKKEKKRKKTKIKVKKKKGKHNFHKEKKRIHANQMLFRNDELNCRIF